MTSSSAPAGRAAPVSESGRVAAMDVARGFALLGIFSVNITFFSDAFGTAFTLKPRAGSGWLGSGLFFFEKVFAEGKFYPLFSTLFGMGLALMVDRAVASGRRYGWLCVRRFLMLLAMGFAHATLLWYGDILFVYALSGLVTTIFIRRAAKSLARAGLVIITAAALLIAGTGALTYSPPAGKAGAPQAAPSPEPGDRPAVPAAPAAETDAQGPGAEAAPEAAPKKKDPFEGLPPEFRRTPYGTWLTRISAGEITQGPADPIWLDLERRAYREGPYLQTLLFRTTTWAFFLVLCVLSYFWHVLSVQLIGAAMAKADFLAPSNARIQRRFCAVGVFVGLPVVALATYLMAYHPSRAVFALSSGAACLAAPLMSYAYLFGWTLIVNSGRARWLTDLLACAGRMALTNYLLQTVTATFVFYYWGLGHFGTWSREACISLVVGVWAAEVVLSALWFRWFQFGPVEWVWRAVTYLTIPPFRRATTG